MSTIRQVLADTRRALQRLPQSEPHLEAELLLCEALSKPRTHLHAWPEQALPANQLAQFQGLRKRRLAGEPMAYILGRKEFWSLDFAVTSATLIPRPETELLVEAALACLPEDQPRRLAELGTGCGAIAAAIASERPRCSVIATERSLQALEQAEANFRQLGLNNIQSRSGDWFSALTSEEPFHLILSNPPYIAEEDPHLVQGDLPWEPREALIAGVDGLEAIRHIVQGAPNYLAPGGCLWLEHGFCQATIIRRLFAQAGFQNIETWQDLAGLDRITGGTLANKD